MERDGELDAAPVEVCAAADDHQNQERLDWLLRGRQRNFEKLGEEDTTKVDPLFMDAGR